MPVGLRVEAGGSLALDPIQLLTAGKLDAEAGRLEYPSTTLELVGREIPLAGEGGQAYRYMTSGRGLGVLGVSGTDPQKRACGDAVALEGLTAAIGVGDDPLAQLQPGPAAVPGRGPGTCTCWDRERQRGACAYGLGLEQVIYRGLSGVVLCLCGLDLGDVRHGSSNDRFPLAGREGLGQSRVDNADLGRHAEGRRKLIC